MRLPVASPADIGFDSGRLETAYALLKEWTLEGSIPAGAIVVGRHGQMVEPRLFGKMGPAADAPPIRPDALFLLASITKPIVYFGAMLLVERGKLSLTDNVTRYLPEFAAHHKEKTLIVHLFTHTSGLDDMVPTNTELREANAPLSEFVKAGTKDTVPLFPAGTKVSYQSIGTMLVAEIVRLIDGRPIAQYLREEIFDPLGLKSIGLGAQGLDEARVVRAQVATEPENLKSGWNSPYWREFGAPWGGMFSSPADFAVLCQLMLGGGKVGDVRIAAPATVAAMTRNWLPYFGDLPESYIRSEPWGLGWRLNHFGNDESWGDLLGPRTFGHTGATGTTVWMDPDTSVFCCLFTNAVRAKQPWKLKQLSNAVAAAVA